MLGVDLATLWAALALVLSFVPGVGFIEKGFGMGPFVTFAAILFRAYVLGPTGALLAVPLTTTVKRLLLAPDEPADAPGAPVAAVLAPPELAGQRPATVPA